MNISICSVCSIHIPQTKRPCFMQKLYISFLQDHGPWRDIVVHTPRRLCAAGQVAEVHRKHFSTCDIYTQQNDHDNSKYSRTSIHTAGREYCRAGGCSAPQRNTRAAQRPADRSEFLKSRIPTKSTVSNNYGVATVSRID